MSVVEKTVEVQCPLSTVYNQWTQFETFPRFMEGIEEVRQMGDTRLHWRADIAGMEREWDAEITEQVPDREIAWRSTTGPENAGTVTFQQVDPQRPGCGQRPGGEEQRVAGEERRHHQPGFREDDQEENTVDDEAVGGRPERQVLVGVQQ